MFFYLFWAGPASQIPFSGFVEPAPLVTADSSLNLDVAFT